METTRRDANPDTGSVYGSQTETTRIVNCSLNATSNSIAFYKTLSFQCKVTLQLPYNKDLYLRSQKLFKLYATRKSAFDFVPMDLNYVQNELLFCQNQYNCCFLNGFVQKNRILGRQWTLLWIYIISELVRIVDNAFQNGIAIAQVGILTTDSVVLQVDPDGHVRVGVMVPSLLISKPSAETIAYASQNSQCDSVMCSGDAYGYLSIICKIILNVIYPEYAHSSPFTDGTNMPLSVQHCVRVLRAVASNLDQLWLQPQHSNSLIKETLVDFQDVSDLFRGSKQESAVAAMLRSSNLSEFQEIQCQLDPTYVEDQSPDEAITRVISLRKQLLDLYLQFSLTKAPVEFIDQQSARLDPARQQQISSFKHKPKNSPNLLLLAAVAWDDAKAVRNQIKHAGKQSSDGKSALMAAAQLHSLNAAKELVHQETNFVDKNGNTALMYATMHGAVEIVRLLAPYESKRMNSAGFTALMMASYFGLYECAKILTNYEVLIQNVRGECALMLAALNGKDQIVIALQNSEGCCVDMHGMNALHYAVQSGDKNSTQLLLLKYFDEEKEETSITPLIMSACVKNGVFTGSLIQAFACKQDKNGMTALMHASKRNKLSLIDAILSQTDEQNMCDCEGKTALMYAAKFGSSQCIAKLLCESGQQDKNGFTALMYAAQRNLVQAVTKLAKKEAKCTTFDSKETGLMLAARSGHDNTVQVLLDYETGMQNAQGQTALMIAVDNLNAKCAQLLLESEAGFVDKQGNTALIHCFNQILRYLTSNTQNEFSHELASMMQLTKMFLENRKEAKATNPDELNKITNEANKARILNLLSPIEKLFGLQK